MNWYTKISMPVIDLPNVKGYWGIGHSELKNKKSNTKDYIWWIDSKWNLVCKPAGKENHESVGLPGDFISKGRCEISENQNESRCSIVLNYYFKNKRPEYFFEKSEKILDSKFSSPAIKRFDF